jgi:hypothetical protein
MSERKRPSLEAPKLEDQPEVDVFGRAYAVRPVTRSVQIKLAEMEAAAETVQGADAEFAVIADQFDVLLAPVNGQRTPASKLLLENWKAERLATPALAAFFQDVLQLAAERPT